MIISNPFKYLLKNSLNSVLPFFIQFHSACNVYRHGPDAVDHQQRALPRVGAGPLRWHSNVRQLGGQPDRVAHIPLPNPVPQQTRWVIFLRRKLS